MDIDVGEVKKVEDYVASRSGGGDGPQPVDIASRVVAHLMHRIPGSRKIAKKFEGEDKRSGILSDLGVLIFSLASRNEEAIMDAGEAAIVDIFDRGKPSPPGPPVVVDLGRVNPVSVPNQQ